MKILAVGLFTFVVAMAAAPRAGAAEWTAPWAGRFVLVDGARSCPGELSLAIAPAAQTSGTALAVRAADGTYGADLRLGHRRATVVLDGEVARPWAQTVDAILDGATLTERAVWERCSTFFGLVNCGTLDIRIRERRLTLTADGLELVEQVSTGAYRTSGQRRCVYRGN